MIKVIVECDVCGEVCPETFKGTQGAPDANRYLPRIGWIVLHRHAADTQHLCSDECYKSAVYAGTKWECEGCKKEVSLAEIDGEHCEACREDMDQCKECECWFQRDLGGTSEVNSLGYCTACVDQMPTPDEIAEIKGDMKFHAAQNGD